jgi:site-specific DNA-cytosine methylase
MRVLVACEFSGIVRQAFLTRGHDAWSCDLLRTEINPHRHIQDDVRNILHDNWDLLIGHPPCTYLSNAARQHELSDLSREPLAIEAADFFLALWNAPIPRIALENPPGSLLRRTGIPVTQLVYPWQFGASTDLHPLSDHEAESSGR